MREWQWLCEGRWVCEGHRVNGGSWVCGGRCMCEVSGFSFQVDPPEAPAQLEGDPENEGLPTAIGRLTRSHQVGS